MHKIKTMKNYLRKIIAALIFVTAAIFGANTQSEFYGDISLLLTIIIIFVSVIFMGIAVQIWKGEIFSKDGKNKNNSK